ncbi:hypothetical protein QFC21_005849 [Naganishia friedmannii]|uniref:Uncharacterized protein n=1 Tax=Naganishia friedmannii TaxID=89922 RepID=A0ACC2V702_9TREE|nr:hypothetical protein QFC21_005849 [Naganishia friedmannii]
MSFYNENITSSVSASATAPAAVVSTLNISSASATAHAVAGISPSSTLSVSVSATAHAAVGLEQVSHVVAEVVCVVKDDRKCAEVSTLKSCLKKADRVSIPKKQLWTAIHQLIVYDVQLEERYDTGKFPLEAGEIGWDQWRAQKEWNVDNRAHNENEGDYILSKMEEDADWDPDFDLDLDYQKRDANEMVKEQEVVRLVNVLEDFAVEFEEAFKAEQNALKGSDSGWDLYLFGANPSLLDEDAPFDTTGDPKHPDDIFDREIERLNEARANYHQLIKEVEARRKELEALINEEVMRLMAIELDAEEERKQQNALKPAESDWTVYLYGANPAIDEEEPPFALTPCDSDLSLALFANEVAANVVEKPTKKVVAIFTDRNAEIESLGIPLSQSDKDIRVRISRNETPFLSVADEIFFEPGRLPFEYRLAVQEEDGEMSMLMDVSLSKDEATFGLKSSESNMVVKFRTMDDVTFTDMSMFTNEVMGTLLPSLVSVDQF